MVEVTINRESFKYYDQLKYNITQFVNIKINYNMQNEEILNQIEDVSKNNSGNYSAVLHLMSHKGQDQKILSKKLKFSIENDVLDKIRKIVGHNMVWLSM